jgi:hypothetical protein
MAACPCSEQHRVMTTSCTASWVAWSLSDREASLRVRELAARCWQTVSARVPFVLLHTCQRVEIYADSRWHPQMLGLPLLEAARPLRGPDVLRHLIRVTAGWRSVVEGESEIQGQVKRAYLQAACAHRLPASLHYLFQKSLRAGKILRYRMGEQPERFEEQVVQLLQANGGAGPIGFVGTSILNARILARSAHVRSQAVLFSRFIPSKGPLVSLPRRPLEEAMQGPAVRALVVSSTAEGLWIEHLHPDCQMVIDCSAPPRVDPKLRGKAKIFTLETLHENLRETSVLHRDVLDEAERLSLCYLEGWRVKQVKGGQP